MKATEIEAILKCLPPIHRETAKRLKVVGSPMLTLHHLHSLNKERNALRADSHMN